MHVGLNLLYLVPGATGGTETYARELVPELLKAAPGLALTAFINREAADDPAYAPWQDLIPSVTVPVRSVSRAQWVRGEQQLLPGLAARAQVDLLHSLANTAPVRGPFKRVVTIHDLLHRLFPEAHSGLLSTGMRVLVTAAARRSDRVIVDAASTGSDVERALHIPAERIDVCPLGYGTRAPTAVMAAAEVRRLIDIGERPIVLCVSAKRRHKNLGRLIQATASIPNERRPTLVISGYPTPHEEELRAQIDDLGLDDDVRLLGWVDADLLEGLYAAARCLVFPSLYEGFGLPVLEAMSRGLPVICSDRGSLAEVAGGAALLVDPLSVSQIASAIERLMNDDQEIERLRTLGRTQVSKFTWAATAASTLSSYERALRAAPVS